MPTTYVDLVGDYGFKNPPTGAFRSVAIRHRVHDKSIYAPIRQLAHANGVGPHGGGFGIRRVARFVHTASYEETTQIMS